MTQADISRGIINRLEERSWSRRKLARQAVMNNVTLGRKLNGEYSFTLEELFRICDALDVTLTELIGQDAA